MTPEEMMQEALEAAGIDVMESGASLGGATVEHGAAAIRRALAEQRAAIVAWLKASYEDGKPYDDDDGYGPPGYSDAIYGIKEGEPEAWAARTGFKPPE